MKKEIKKITIKPVKLDISMNEIGEPLLSQALTRISLLIEKGGTTSIEFHVVQVAENKIALIPLVSKSTLIIFLRELLYPKSTKFINILMV